MRKTFLADDAPRPRGPFSHAAAGGPMVFLTGQSPSVLGPDEPQASFVEEARQTFQHLQSVARAAGGDLDDVIRVGIYLRDMSNFDEMNGVYREFFTEPYPARTTIQSNIDISIEVDAVLWLGDR